MGRLLTDDRPAIWGFLSAARFPPGKIGTRSPEKQLRQNAVKEIGKQQGI
jgi:hypothetical protein